jgi:hypothetical protein
MKFEPPCRVATLLDVHFSSALKTIWRCACCSMDGFLHLLREVILLLNGAAFSFSKIVVILHHGNYPIVYLPLVLLPVFSVIL